MSGSRGLGVRVVIVLRGSETLLLADPGVYIRLRQTAAIVRAGRNVAATRANVEISAPPCSVVIVATPNPLAA